MKNSPFRTTSRPRYRKYSKGRQGSPSPCKHRQSRHRSPSPTNTRRSSHQSRRQRSPTRAQQVSHIKSSTDTSPEGKLHMDVTSDGHTSFPYYTSDGNQARKKFTPCQSRSWCRCEHHTLNQI